MGWLRAPTRPRYRHEHELVDIDDLIAIKAHVGRPKDLVTAVQLRAIRSRLPPR